LGRENRRVRGWGVGEEIPGRPVTRENKGMRMTEKTWSRPKETEVICSVERGKWSRWEAWRGDNRILAQP
jgi:hypothetical protein